MIDLLTRTAEEWFGIKANPEDVKRLQVYLKNTYGGADKKILEKVFLSGEAADFLTVNETYFFREPFHFDFLKDLLPSFEKTGIRICSAAASTGCEAYSIAMLIEAYNKGRNPLPYHIDAFDINPRVIETASQGVYSARALREDGNCFRYMTAPYLREKKDGYQIDCSLQKNICFFVHNLMDELPGKDYDLIFFRNAFIYFSPRNRDRILANLSAALKEGGILIPGVSETASVKHDDLAGKNRNDVFYFQKSTQKTKVPVSIMEKMGAVLANRKTAGKTRKRQKKELVFDNAIVGDILANEENAAKTAERILQSINGSIPADGLNGNELVVSVLHLLKTGDFLGAGSILDRLETLDNSPITVFLRGEYFFLQDLYSEAEFYYKISLGKNDAFWPAGYRLCSLASVDVLKKYRAQKALESLRKGENFRYEFFIEGFSPDYYAGVLLKQNAG
jgi:chemotaxis protein methyltransferase CheR